MDTPSLRTWADLPLETLRLVERVCEQMYQPPVLRPEHVRNECAISKYLAAWGQHETLNDVRAAILVKTANKNA